MKQIFHQSSLEKISVASAVYSERTGENMVFISIENERHKNGITVERIILPKWDMKNVKVEGDRNLELSNEEHHIFVKALASKEGEEAIRRFKNDIVNKGTDEVIDFLCTKVFKKDGKLKEYFNSLKTVSIPGYDNKSTRSLSISVRDMYDHLVSKGIIKH